MEKNPTIDDISSVTFTNKQCRLSKSTFKKLKQKGIKVYLNDLGGTLVTEIRTEEDIDKYLNKSSMW